MTVKLKKVETQAEFNFISNYSYRNIRHFLSQDTKIDLESFDRNFNMLHKFWKEKCHMKIMVASEDHNIFLGFIVWQDTAPSECNLWFVGVKEMYRSAGLATRMVEACLDHDKIKYFFHTHSLSKIQNKLPKKRKKPIRPETQEFFDKLYLSDLFNGFVDLSS